MGAALWVNVMPKEAPSTARVANCLTQSNMCSYNGLAMNGNHEPFSPFQKPPRSGLYLLLAPQTSFRAHLSSILLSWARANNVYVIDAGYGFPGYHLAREAARRGVSLEQALHRIRLARAFTGHQLIALLQSPDLRGPALLIDPLALFLDEDVSLVERRSIWFRMLTRVRILRVSIPILVALRDPAPESARVFLQPLWNEADAILWDTSPPPLRASSSPQPSLFQEVKHGSDASFR